MKTRMMTAAIMLGAGLASANPVDGEYSDGPLCDNHGFLRAIEELGTSPFPQDELIDATWQPTNLVACSMTDDPSFPNALVTIVNLSGRYWDNLFYVADPETSFSNVDGLAMSYAAPGVVTEAFRIDWVGGNRPLVFESMAVDNVFEPGEMWQFIVQDYGNAFGLGPDAMSSLDFSGASAGDSFSAASIVQMVVPAPGSAALLALGGLLAVRRRR